MFKRHPIIVALAFTISSVPVASSAAEGDFDAIEDRDGQHVVFRDDPLAALAADAAGATIVVRPGAVRALLLRPRTQFVGAMLRSVENL